MNLKTLSFYRRLFFLLLLCLGFSYIAFLVFFTPKVYSGFLMQLIFLIDAINIHSFAILFQPNFTIQIFIGVFWSYFLFLVVKSVINIFSQINQTQKFVQSLNITRTTKQYFVFNSPEPQVFTVGFTNPQIFLSQKLLDISTPSELLSIIYHEQSHVLNRDPLKDLMIEFIKNFIPVFPLKSWLFGQYLTFVEISADSYSQTHNHHPTSLVSALLKVQKFHQPQFVSNFSAQSERLKILIGQKSQSFKSILLTNLAIFTFLIVVSSSIYHTNIFYECDHLIKCFENLITPDHTITSPMAESHHCLNQ